MQLPSVENVNATRLSRFDDAITAALEQEPRIEAFRDIIGHYVEHHDVPEVDVAAALAVVAQGDTPLLLSEEDVRREQREQREQRERERDARGDRDARDPRGERSGRGARDGRESRDRRNERDGRDRRDSRGDRDSGPERRIRPASGPMAMYRIAVGKRQKVEPRQIVGALANEGGLSRQDFGAIDIRPDFSLVELPASLPDDVLSRLEGTRISGKLIELRPDRGGNPRHK